MKVSVILPARERQRAGGRWGFAPKSYVCVAIASVLWLASWAWPLTAAAQPKRQDPRHARASKHLVENFVAKAGVKDPRVLESILQTPRHEFVPFSLRDKAYFDMALPIGDKQTISSPFIVAYMTESLATRPDHKVLEIGTGSGYQAAVLSPLVKDVYSIEIVKELGESAAKLLKRLEYDNVHVKVGDGFKGWAEHAPFDRIIVTCSPEKVPTPLVQQLREGGRMVIPVGERYQQTLFLFRKENGKLKSEALRPTLFVPMTGTAEKAREVQPDGANPKLINGGFEKRQDDRTDISPGWYYQRQMEVVESEADAPEGKRYVRFKNEDVGRASHLLQGMAMDGRVVKTIEIGCRVKTENVQDFVPNNDFCTLAISFYDKNRGDLGAWTIGPQRGTEDWRLVRRRIRVPPDTRECIVRLGLFGSTGEAAFDDVTVRVTANAK